MQTGKRGELDMTAFSIVKTTIDVDNADCPRERLLMDSSQFCTFSLSPFSIEPCSSNVPMKQQ
jgi:hypothetical protein